VIPEIMPYSCFIKISSCQFGVDNSGAWDRKLGRGDLELSKLTRKYITDPENPRKWSLVKKKKTFSALVKFRNIVEF